MTGFAGKLASLGTLGLSEECKRHGPRVPFFSMLYHKIFRKEAENS